MRFALLLIVLLRFGWSAVAQNSPPIGQWQEHLPYHQVIGVIEIDGRVWAATPYSLFSVATSDNSIERYSKINGLTETGIRTIGKDAAGKNLLVAYNTGNIDIISDEGITNIRDIAQSRLISDKTINSIYSSTARTWLAGNEAIYLLNTDKGEVQDTYVIGDGGAKLAIYSLAVVDGFLCAGTSQGIKSAPVNGQNLSDFRSWRSDTSAAVSQKQITDIISLNNSMICHSADTLFIRQGNTWSILYSGGWNIVSLQAMGGKLLVNEVLNDRARVVVLNINGATDRVVTHPSLRVPLQSIKINDDYWIADSLSGLLLASANTNSSIKPASPSDITLGAVIYNDKTLVAAAGAVDDNWEALNIPARLSSLRNNEWTNYDSSNILPLRSARDIITIALDPIDQTIWAGSYGDGLLHLKADSKADQFKANSFIKETYFTPGSFRVAGLAFDQDHNLWISNYGADQNLLVRKPDGTTTSFRTPFPLIDNALSEIVIDDLNQKWIISPKGNGLICFSHGESFENMADDRWKWYRSGATNGNLPDNDVLSIAKDKDGFIWVGTTRGIAVIRCIQDVFLTGSCEAIRPIVQQDNFAGYLFSNERVQAIAVDGANRKWVGTKNGLWLLSADGEKVMYRFSVENSPLNANDVKRISINGETGEVFIATSAGMCSFRGTATEAVLSSKNLLVFPNPVPPGYSGTIAIRGLTNNATVKITELNGNLVFQTKSLGGQAVWNGRDYKGRQISSGVYLVLVSDETSAEKVATKIVFINK